MTVSELSTQTPEALAASAQSAPGGLVPHLVIEPPSGWQALRLGEIWQFRDLLMSLASRDLKLRYKQTALGVLWVVLQPLMTAGVMTIVFGRIAKLPTDGVPGFLFTFTGMLGWNLFNNILTRSSMCLVGNSHLISKVYFPRLVLPMSQICSALVDFAVATVMLVVLMFVYHFPPSWGLLTLPIWMILMMMMSLGVGLFTAALTVSYRDVQYVLPVVVNILQFASPIAYASSDVGKSLQLPYHLNPLAGLLEAFHWSILHTTPPVTWALAYSAGMAVVALWIGATSFKQMERKFADVI
jgi:lipopolysaccharide transport system permease protein